MQKYFIRPGWEIVPYGNGVKFVSLEDKSVLFLKNRKNTPDILSLLEAVRNGLSKEVILPHFKEKIDQLQGLGIIFYIREKWPKRKPSNYLELLEKFLVGPDKIVNSVKVQKNNELTIAEASGFGSEFIFLQPSLNYGWGIDQSPIMAKIKAIVECVERFALSNFHEGNFVKGNWEKMKNNSLSPVQLGTNIESLKNAGLLEWEKLSGENSEDYIYAPIDFLYHPIDYWKLGRIPVCPMSLSGVAAHQTIDAAKVNGLLELCEHEALMVSWFGKRNTASIEVDSLDVESQKILTKLENIGWKVHVKDISLDLSPVAMAVAIKDGNERLAIGSSAAFTLRYAAKKAIMEMARAVLFDQNYISTGSIKDKDVRDVVAHAQYYLTRKNVKKASHLWKGQKGVKASNNLTWGKMKGLDLNEAEKKWAPNEDVFELEYLRKLFEKAGIKVFWKDMTPKFCKQDNLPIVVIRTISPEMARLVVGYNQRPTPTDRYKYLLRRYGKASDLSLARVHPFS